MGIRWENIGSKWIGCQEETEGHRARRDDNSGNKPLGWSSMVLFSIITIAKKPGNFATILQYHPTATTSSSPMRKLKPLISALRMAASFRLNPFVVTAPFHGSFPPRKSQTHARLGQSISLLAEVASRPSSRNWIRLKWHPRRLAQALCRLKWPTSTVSASGSCFKTRSTSCPMNTSRGSGTQQLIRFWMSSFCTGITFIGLTLTWISASTSWTSPKHSPWSTNDRTNGSRILALGAKALPLLLYSLSIGNYQTLALTNLHTM